MQASEARKLSNKNSSTVKETPEEIKNLIFPSQPSYMIM